MRLQPYSYRLNDAPTIPETRHTQQFRSELRSVLRGMPDDKTRLQHWPTVRILERLLLKCLMPHLVCKRAIMTFYIAASLNDDFLMKLRNSLTRTWRLMP